VTRYLLRKLVLYLLTFYFAVTIDWAIPRLMPGDPIDRLLSRMQAQPSSSEALTGYYTQAFGFDVPVWKQYLKFVKQTAGLMLTVPMTSGQQEIEERIATLNRHLLLGALLFILAGAGLGYSMAERISDPVNRLTRATRRISRGDLNAFVVGRSSDELRRLVEDFNSMAAELKRRLSRAGERFRETDHGYCKSIYTTTPDGMILEFTCDPADAAEIDAIRRADAHSELARWLAGDHRINNELRHRQCQLNTSLTKS